MIRCISMGEKATHKKLRAVPTSTLPAAYLSQTLTVPYLVERSSSTQIHGANWGHRHRPLSPPPPSLPQPTPGKPRMTPTAGRLTQRQVKTLTPTPGCWCRLRASVQRRRHAALSLPADPCSRQPFSASETPIAEPLRAVQYPRGLRNTEPLIAGRNRRGGRRAWRARHSIAWSFRALPRFGENYPTAWTVCALAQRSGSREGGTISRLSPSLSAYER